MTENKKISLLLESILNARIDFGDEQPNKIFKRHNRFSHYRIDFAMFQRTTKYAEFSNFLKVKTNSLVKYYYRDLNQIFVNMGTKIKI